MSDMSHYPSQGYQPLAVPQYPTPPPSGPPPPIQYSPLPPTGPPIPSAGDVTTMSTVTYVQQHPSAPVTEGLAKAYEECKNSVLRVASHCRAKNRKFRWARKLTDISIINETHNRDIDFDIENDADQCLYNLMDSNTSSAAMEARRVTEIFENPVFYSGTSDSAQAVQRAIENCYLVSALSTLTSTDRLIQNLCVAVSWGSPLVYPPLKYYALARRRSWRIWLHILPGLLLGSGNHWWVGFNFQEKPPSRNAFILQSPLYKSPQVRAAFEKRKGALSFREGEIWWHRSERRRNPLFF